MSLSLLPFLDPSHTTRLRVTVPFWRLRVTAPSGRWRVTALLGLAPLLTLLAAAPANASRGNPGGFSLAAQSTVPYIATPHRAAVDCQAMNLTLSSGIVVSARLIAATAKAPEHCRLSGTIPAEIVFEVNLPTQWNGRLWMYGNGGYAGEHADEPKEVESREAGLSKGFATARSDTGHARAKEPLATFALNRLDKVIDHAYRAVHETNVLAKQLVATYYARTASYSYWDGCSTGGRQGMMAASRYPQDFDGVLAGAPTLRWSDVMMKGLANQRALDSAPTLNIAKLENVFKHVVAKCDAKDGVTDGLISNPPACDFDPAKDLPRCTGAVNDDCFTEAEVQALARLRAGPRIKGREYFPQHWGVEHSTTSIPWLFVPATAAAPNPLNGLTAFGQSYMKYLAFDRQDPNYDWNTFNLDTDPDRMAGIDALLNPRPELGAFRERNGKILTYWGWADAALNVVMGTDYYDAVTARLGREQTQSFYRMFLVPGLAHCGGGYGPNVIDGMTPLIEWVEAGRAPDRLRAQHFDATSGAKRYDRAYCPYPQRTVHTGGDTEQASNWRCEAAEVTSEQIGGCSIGDGRDASLPLLLAGAGWFAWRRRRAAGR